MYYSYTPKYDDLDYLFNKYIKTDNKRLSFFFDVKNGVYSYEEITESNKGEHAVELISAVINVIQYIKNRYSTMCDIKNRLSFYFFCETGKSSYHKGIDMAYKANRGINDFLERSTSDVLASQVMFFAINTLHDIINSLPNAYFFMGEYSEYDYIPYVIAKEKFDEHDIGVVFSSDKDMYQLNSYFNSFEQLEKITRPSNWHPGRIFIHKDNYVERYMYKDLKGVPMTDDQKRFLENNFSLFRAIIGDSGDNVLGIKGIGNNTLLKLLPKFEKYILPRCEYNEIIKKMNFDKFDFKRENSIFNLEDISELEKDMKSSKKLRDLFDPKSIERICRNLALMDYDIMYERRKSKEKEYIESITKNQNKFNTNEEVCNFINKTGLWVKYPLFKVSIDIGE